MLSLGTITEWGELIAIGWVGERYYWFINEEGTISMTPAKFFKNPTR